jgi:hypothetical protein
MVSDVRGRRNQASRYLENLRKNQNMKNVKLCIILIPNIVIIFTELFFCPEYSRAISKNSLKPLKG